MVVLVFPFVYSVSSASQGPTDVTAGCAKAGNEASASLTSLSVPLWSINPYRSHTLNALLPLIHVYISK